MPKICYTHKSFQPKRATVIAHANSILEEYAAQGYTLTLRQLYYQFVARDLIPNTKRDYDNLGSTINDARLAGLIDWSHLEDRTRNLESRSHWNDPADIVESCAQSYHIDLWQGQKNYVEVWVEKEALAGVIERPAHGMDVPWFCCRGYVSQSEAWRAAMRLKRHAEQACKIIHLGDHDPSGVDMTRDIQERFYSYGCFDVEVVRIALNMDQIERYNPPPNPAKLSDTRAERYIEEHGVHAWELDALEPSVLDTLISDTIKGFVDYDLYVERVAQRDEEREQLRTLSEHWDDVVEYLAEGDE